MDISSLREETEGVFERLAALLHQEWSDFERWSSKEKIITRLKERCAPEGEGLTLLAMDSTELLATASIIPWELKGNPAHKYWLGEVLTAPAHRGKGIAGKLIRAIVDAASMAKYPALWLYTPDKQAFYHSLGWRSVEERDVDDERVTVMVLDLVTFQQGLSEET